MKIIIILLLFSCLSTVAFSQEKKPETKLVVIKLSATQQKKLAEIEEAQRKLIQSKIDYLVPILDGKDIDRNAVIGFPEHRADSLIVTIPK